MSEKEEGRRVKLEDVLVAGLISCFYIFDMSNWSSRSIILSTGLLLLLFVFRNSGKIHFRIEKFHKYMMCFIAYSFLSAVWSWDSSQTISRSLTVLLVFICMSVIYLAYEERGSVEGLFYAIMLSGVIISLYSIRVFGLTSLRMATSIGARLEGDDFYANVNSIGMWMSLCAVVFVYHVLNTRFRLWYLTGLLPLFIIAVTQSRTALIEMLFGVLLVVYIKASDSPSISKKITNILLGFTGLVIILFFASQLKMFSGINERMRSMLGLSTQIRERSTSLRQEMINVGLRQFSRSPFIGIGFGSTHVLTRQYLGLNTYLHNNFIEVLVSGGIIGFVIYYAMYLYVIKSLLRLKSFGNSDVKLCLCLALTQLISDYGTVSFYKKATYVVLVVCFLCVAMQNFVHMETELYRK